MLAAYAFAASALHTPVGSNKLDRRHAIGLGFAAAAAGPNLGAASAAEPMIKVYFGAGCFWHVQHEFVGEEVAALRRTPDTITARAGYAGGLRTGDGGKLCYHNPRQFADYGKFGHAEVCTLYQSPSFLHFTCR